MKHKDAVEDFLKREPRFRERVNKDKGIVSMLMNMRNLNEAKDKFGNFITLQKLVEFVQDYATMDRAWRQLLERNEKYRGNDYEEKDKLEVKKLAQLGYSVPVDLGPARDVEPETQQKLL